MSRPVIRLSSITYAIRGQKLLEQQGITAHIKKLSKNTYVNGCGYGLEISGDVQSAAQILEGSDIRIIEIVGE